MRRFGHIPNYPPGSFFDSRADLSNAKVHPPRQAGISGGQNEGADSIVLSGGYEDDLDFGAQILYTGHGSNDSSSGTQTGNQYLSRQNLALAVSCNEAKPVRVIRGARHTSQWSPDYGYEYSGLYAVRDYWLEKGKSGFQIVRFLLEAIPGETILELAPTKPEGREGSPRRLQEEDAEFDTTNPEYELTQRLIRSSKEILHVKELHQNQCQICGYGIKTPAGIYSEGAHIVPLGFPHHGQDHRSNILCLCPDDHVAFDRGTYVIEDDLSIWDTVDSETIGTLITHPYHELSLDNIRNHRRRFKFS